MPESLHGQCGHPWNEVACKHEHPKVVIRQMKFQQRDEFHLAEPLLVADRLDDYRSNRREAVQKLTEELAKRLQPN